MRNSEYRYLGGIVFFVIGWIAIPLPAETVDYRVTFDAVWSPETHPESFPPAPHFSHLVGATHNQNVTFWEVGGAPTVGMEAMAEEGSIGPLIREVNSAINAGHAEFVLSGDLLNPSPGNVSYDFQVSDEFSFVTLVTMIAPSPDWFVGVNNWDLRPNGEWTESLTYELWAYDAGTDDGENFTSSNFNIFPKKPISLLDTFPFENAPPLGTFTFTLLVDDPIITMLEQIEALSFAIRNSSHDTQYDWNDDGSVDQEDRVFWVHEVANTYFGDSNLDGEFNSRDLVTVFEIGQYEDGIAGNSTWKAGDWDGDSDVTTADLTLAFQDGGYEQGPRSALLTVPEPIGWNWLVVGWIAFVRFTRRNR